ncbi:MAG: hypothetical protein SFY69_08770 [Planctomycetota bacterium]|nr:hypothetical protein [Planctomycetota bacterium]
MRMLVAMGVVVGAGVALAQSDVRCVPLPVTPTDAALDTSRGALAVVDGASITLFPKAFLDSAAGATAVGPVRLDGKPRCVTFVARPEGDVFVVGLGERSSMVVLDAQTLKEKAPALALPGEQGVTDLSTPTADGTFYASARLTDGSASLARVNGRTLRVESLVQADNYLGDSAIEASADGAWVFAWRASDTTPNPTALRLAPGEGEHAWRLSTQRPERREREPEGVPVVDGWGQFVGAGTTLYDGQLQAPAGVLPGRAAAAFRDRPLVICVQDAVATAVSANTMETLGQAALPAACGWGSVEGGRRRGSSGQARVLGFADASNDRVILVQGANARVVPLAAMNAAKKEPVLGVAVGPTGSLVAGKAATIALTRADASVKVELTGAPEGMTLSGSQIRWTPGLDQVGDHAVTLTLRAGAGVRTQQFEARVVRDGVDLPFVAKAVAISPDGRRAVAWRFEQDHGRRDGPSSRLCVVDLVARKVLAETSFVQGITAASVDGTYVYVAFNEGNVVAALDLANLGEKHRVFLKHDARTITPVDGRLVFVEGNGQSTVLATPGFVEAKAGELPPGVRREADHMRRFGRLGEQLVRLPGGWLYEGVVYDESMKTPRLLTSLGRGGVVLSGEGQRGGLGAEYVPAAWGRRVSGTQISLPNGASSVGGNFQAQGSVLLTTRPVVASLVLDRADGSGRTKDRTVQIVLRELLTGAAGQSPIVLSKEDLGPLSGYESPSYGGSVIAAAGDRVVAIDRSRLYDVTVTDAQCTHAAPPLEIVPTQSAFVLGKDGETLLRHETRGGTAPVEFELLGGYSWMTLDSASGTIRVDNRAAFDQASQQVKSQIGYAGGMVPMPEGSGRMVDERRRRIDELAGQNAALFTAVSGKSPAGIPVVVQVSLAAKDRSSQTAGIAYQVFIDVPVEPVLAQLAKDQEEQQRRELAQRAEWEARAKEEQARAAAASAPAADAGRIQALEDRVRALEAKIDLLMQLLKDKPGATPR